MGTEKSLQLIQVNFNSKFFHLVIHVESHEHINFQFHNLGGKIKIPFKIGAGNNIYNNIGFFFQYKITGNNFFRRVGCQRICPRQIGYMNSVAFVVKDAFIFFNGYTGKVTYFLMSTDYLVKKACFPAVRIPQKSNTYFS